MTPVLIFLILANLGNIVLGIALMQISPLRFNALYRALMAAMLMALACVIYFYACQAPYRSNLSDFGEIMLSLAMFFKMLAGVVAYQKRCHRCGPNGCMPPTL
jgi:hypothetical protein